MNDKFNKYEVFLDDFSKKKKKTAKNGRFFYFFFNYIKVDNLDEEIEIEENVDVDDKLETTTNNNEEDKKQKKEGTLLELDTQLLEALKMIDKNSTNEIITQKLNKILFDTLEKIKLIGGKKKVFNLNTLKNYLIILGI